MTKTDISTALTHRLSTILEDCRRIEPALQAYLKASDERPNINFELLRIGELKQKSLTVFEEVCSDKLEIEQAGNEQPHG